MISRIITKQLLMIAQDFIVRMFLGLHVWYFIRKSVCISGRMTGIKIDVLGSSVGQRKTFSTFQNQITSEG